MKKSYPLSSFSLVYVFLVKLFLKKENNVNYFSFLLVKISDKSPPLFSSYFYGILITWKSLGENSTFLLKLVHYGY